MTLRNSKNKGFTLIELLLSISLIGVLSGLVVGMISYSGVRSKMRDNTRISNVRMIQNALESYFVDYRHYPEQLSWGSIPTVLQTEGFIKQIPQDPDSTRQYYYLSDTNGGMYAIVASMEVETSAQDHTCADLNYNGGLPAGILNDAFCYGVESPTVLR